MTGAQVEPITGYLGAGRFPAVETGNRHLKVFSEEAVELFDRLDQ